MDTFDLTPSPALLKLIGQIPFKGWQCIAELIDNSIDAIINHPELDASQKVISVSIPTKGKLKNNEPVIIEDWGIGMTDKQLENAVKAGFSSKNTMTNLGLFGMGFNVATSRLANTVEVWTSTADMDYEIGVRIDLREMTKNHSFIRPRLKRSKTANKKSGTQICIFEYTPVAENLLKSKDIVENLNRAYSERIFVNHGISVYVNKQKIKPFKFCVWNKERSVRYKNEQIPTVYEIEEKFSDQLFCENCYSWIGDVLETSVGIECPSCHEKDSIIKKEISISGWVGIQRYTDTEHYGIDISRNGRILSRLDKTFFNWTKDGFDTRLNPEYPRDTPHAGGRIVGQIEANYIVPKYTKDDFERDDQNWQKAVDFIRGNEPLQPEIASSLKYLGINRSPVGRLFAGYRKVSPPGVKTLIAGKSDGSADYTTPRQWAKSFYEGDPAYQDDSIWWEAVSRSDLRDNNSSFNPLNPLGPSTTNNNRKGVVQPVQPEQESFPGKKIIKETKKFDLEKVIGERPIEITIIDYKPTRDIKSPIIFDPQGQNKFFVYLNNNHALFRDFADGYSDLIFMEVAAKYSALKNNSEEWPITRIYYELKNKYAPETMLSVATLVNRSNELMRKIHNYLVEGDGIRLDSRPNLDENDIKGIKKRYLELEHQVLSDANKFIYNTRFLKYLDLSYVFKFIEQFPELVFDKKVFDLPYSILEDEIKKQQLQKYLEYFNDVKWFMTKLSNEGDEAIKKSRTQIIRNRFSIEILYGSLC